MIIQIMSADELIEATLRRETTALLAECTGPQHDFFRRIFPNGVAELADDKLKSAYELCRRTVEKNRTESAQSATTR